MGACPACCMPLADQHWYLLRDSYEIEAAQDTQRRRPRGALSAQRGLLLYCRYKVQDSDRLAARRTRVLQHTRMPSVPRPLRLRGAVRRVASGKDQGEIVSPDPHP